MPFRVERSSADVRDGVYGAGRLLLFESGSDHVDAGIAVHVKRACAVGDGFLIRENENRRGRELRQHFSHQLLHSRREGKRYPLPKEPVNRTKSLRYVGQRTKSLRYVGQTIGVIVDTTHEYAHLLNVSGHRQIGQCRPFFPNLGVGLLEKWSGLESSHRWRPNALSRGKA